MAFLFLYGDMHMNNNVLDNVFRQPSILRPVSKGGSIEPSFCSLEGSKISLFSNRSLIPLSP